jgi:hypothetical protein
MPNKQTYYLGKYGKYCVKKLFRFFRLRVGNFSSKSTQKSGTFLRLTKIAGSSMDNQLMHGWIGAVSGGWQWNLQFEMFAIL